jgi:hypothetical protein
MEDNKAVGSLQLAEGSRQRAVDNFTIHY